MLSFFTSSLSVPLVPMVLGVPLVVPGLPMDPLVPMVHGLSMVYGVPIFP